MYAATIFIISKRKELSIKYKKLIEALNQEVYVIPSLSEALLKIQKNERKKPSTKWMAFLLEEMYEQARPTRTGVYPYF